MKLLIISPGKAHDPSIKEAIVDFTQRVSHTAPIDWAFVPTDTKEIESSKILKLIKPEDYVVLLDERGVQWSSPELAKFLEGRMNEGTKRLVFVIGGAYGVSEEVSHRAQKTWALSKLVFPHQLVRLILAEQLYRGFSIVKGEKYHHA